MKLRRWKRIVLVLTVLGLVGGAGFLGWSHLADIRLRNRVTQLWDEAERLSKSHATLEEVKRVFGEPDSTTTRDGKLVLFYDPITHYKGYRLETIVLTIDLDSGRVERLGIITHN